MQKTTKKKLYNCYRKCYTVRDIVILLENIEELLMIFVI